MENRELYQSWDLNQGYLWVPGAPRDNWRATWTTQTIIFFSIKPIDLSKYSCLLPFPKVNSRQNQQSNPRTGLLFRRIHYQTQGSIRETDHHLQWNIRAHLLEASKRDERSDNLVNQHWVEKVKGDVDYKQYPRERKRPELWYSGSSVLLRHVAKSLSIPRPLEIEQIGLLLLQKCSR
jgi:hypothetical protein